MNERSRVAVSILVGAGCGGLVGYLYLTEAGRRVRTDLDARLDTFINEMRRLRVTIEKGRQAAQEAWTSLNELVDVASSPTIREPERFRQSFR